VTRDRPAPWAQRARPVPQDRPGRRARAARRGRKARPDHKAHRGRKVHPDRAAPPERSASFAPAAMPPTARSSAATTRCCWLRIAGPSARPRPSRTSARPPVGAAAGGAQTRLGRSSWRAERCRPRWEPLPRRRRHRVRIRETANWTGGSKTSAAAA